MLWGQEEKEAAEGLHLGGVEGDPHSRGRMGTQRPGQRSQEEGLVAARAPRREELGKPKESRRLVWLEVPEWRARPAGALKTTVNSWDFHSEPLQTLELG